MTDDQYRKDYQKFLEDLAKKPSSNQEDTASVPFVPPPPQTAQTDDAQMRSSQQSITTVEE